MNQEFFQGCEPGIGFRDRTLATLPIQILSAPRAQPAAIFPADDFRGKGQQSLILDQGTQIDFLPFIIIRLQIFPGKFNLLGRSKIWVGPGLQAKLNFRGEGQGERVETTGTGAFHPSFDPALHQDHLSRAGKVYPDLDRVRKLKTRAGSFPSQALIQGSLVFRKGLLPPLRGYVFDSNDHSSKSSESNIKTLIYNEMFLCQGKYLPESLVLSPRLW